MDNAKVKKDQPAETWTSKLGSYEVGEVRVYDALGGALLQVRQAACRMKKEGFRFTTNLNGAEFTVKRLV